MKNNRTTGILLLLTMALTCLAQPKCSVKTFDINDGLAANFISGMDQSEDLLMWVATYNGLSCYDGYHFTTFRDQRGAQEVLTSNRLIRINSNAVGNLWCVTYDRHLILFDTKQGKFVDVGEMIHDKFGTRLQPRNIYALKNGHTWVTCEKGLKAVLLVNDSLPIGPDALELIWLDRQAVKASFINKVEEDDDGREWVITDAGVMLYGSDFSVSHHYEWARQQGGCVYLASPDGLLGCWRPGSTQLDMISLPEGVSAIKGIERIGDHQLAVATNRGLAIYDTQTKTCREIALSSPATGYNSLFVDSSQRLWLFSDQRGVTMIDADGQVHQLSMGNTFSMPTATQQHFWTQDQHGTVWLVPTGEAFGYYDEQSAQLVAYPMLQAGYSQEGIPSIDKYFVDHQKNVWFSTKFDLSLVNFNYNDLTFKQVRKNQEARALFTDQDHRLWVGTGDGYVIVYTSSGQLEGYLSASGQLQKEPTRFADRIYTIAVDSRKRVWIGTKGLGLFLVDQGKVQNFRPREDDDYSLSHTDIYAIDEDEQGHIWIGTYENGLNLLSEQPDGSMRFINYNNELSGYNQQDFSKIRRITHDGKGHVIVSASGGMVTFSNQFSQPSDIRFFGSKHAKGDTTSLLTNDVLQTLITRSGRIFTSTMGGGVQELTSKDLLTDQLQFKTLSQFAPEEGNALALVEDKEGIVWVSRETTLNRFDPETGLVSQFGPAALSSQMAFGETLPAYDGPANTIAMGALGGFLQFHPDQMEVSSNIPRLVFTSVRYQDGQAATVQPLLNRGVLKVKADERQGLVINFAAIDYSNNHLIQYAYMLEGTDEDWNYIGQSHSISFNTLPAGRHRLLVRSTNSDGVWVDNQSVLEIEVEATFWESLWCKLLMAIVAIVLLLVAYRLGRSGRSI